ncbi:hypothetical protein BJ684DRAFT_19681 [Piptocephalis cylindrospora]|uniref:Uncharacterized protein n=1 Tax=Piptocephalis cylindrospora TaxID=1907219 RepID=A0A4P9Y6K1_9FUNG|nr:hypothetical protein BJ684DRAFT_19681 [Piptocephalis cylindrospora]|eukprot:RKP13861.1 hypothetical protein BJ684DRAFT_19681 [Piptocephalis cylindrospora]
MITPNTTTSTGRSSRPLPTPPAKSLSSTHHPHKRVPSAGLPYSSSPQPPPPTFPHPGDSTNYFAPPSSLPDNSAPYLNFPEPSFPEPSSPHYVTQETSTSSTTTTPLGGGISLSIQDLSSASASASATDHFSTHGLSRPPRSHSMNHSPTHQQHFGDEEDGDFFTSTLHQLHQTASFHTSSLPAPSPLTAPAPPIIGPPRKPESHDPSSPSPRDSIQ